MAMCANTIAATTIPINSNTLRARLFIIVITFPR